VTSFVCAGFMIRFAKHHGFAMTSERNSDVFGKAEIMTVDITDFVLLGNVPMDFKEYQWLTQT
jgi:hypothetical protein